MMINSLVQRKFLYCFVFHCFFGVAAVNAQLLEEIVVTAQKRSQGLQDVPIAVSVLDGNDLAERGAVDIYDLAAVAPSMVISRDKGSANIYIRGVGNAFVNLGVDGSIAVHQDNVYLSRPRGQVASFYDIERLEVLRGPQGTLYGRNATGGSVNIITRNPSEELEGNIRLTAGSESLIELEGGIGGPLTDKLLGRIAFVVAQHDGFGTNIITGNDVLNRDEQGIRGKLRWLASDFVTVDFEVDYWKADDAAFGSHFFSSIDHPLDGVLAALDQVPVANPEGGPPLGNPNAIPFVSGDQDPSNFWDIASDLDFKRDAEVFGGKIDVQWDINDSWSFRAISGWRSSDASSISDVDSTPLNAARLNEREQSEAFSQELQLSYVAYKHTLQLGFFYFNEDQEGLLTIPWSYTGIDGDDFLQSGNLETDALAFFVNYGYQVSDRLSVTLGGRYSKEEKDNQGLFHFQNLIADNVNPPGQPLNAAAAPTLPFANNDDWSAFTPRLTVDFALTNETLIYGSVSRGFKSGQFSLGDIAASADPEFLVSYEVGLKSRFWSNRAQANITAFFYDYEDIQFQVIRTGALGIENVAAAEVMGLEAELSFAVTENLRIDTNIGLLDSEYKDAFITDPLDPPGTADVEVSGNQLVSAPEVTFSFSIVQDINLSKGDLTLRFDYRYTDDVFFTPFNRALESQDAYSNVGARIAYVSQQGNWGLSLWGKNLGNKEVKVGISSVPPWLGANQIGGVNKPRSYGLDLTYQF